MAATASSARLRELAASPGGELAGADPADPVACCADVLRAGAGGGAEASCAALDSLCLAARGGGAEGLRGRADELAPLVVGRLGDADAAVREAARRFLMVLMEMKEMNARTEKTEPPPFMSDVPQSHCLTAETEASDTNQARKSPKAAKANTKETSLLGGEGDITRKSVEPIKVFSEKELVREIEKVAFTLQPDKEWSVRITAMQRVEGLVLGGAADYSAFPMLLKQLVTPLITQLLDRRSSVVKQACHLLSFLSKELLRVFEPCAELLIPVLLKDVVITVLVIAESADNCIKEMLRNCKVARILPRIIELAKNDRSAVIRARCCEYALLMLDCWVDTPEIQRSADLYEELIKCCIADATSEVRSTARTCYRTFSRVWPERSHRLFSSFEPSRQKMINDEEVDMHKHVPAEERTKLKQAQSSTCIPILTEDEAPASTEMDKCVSIDSEISLKAQPSLEYDDMSFKSTLEAAKDDVPAVESSFESGGALASVRTAGNLESSNSGVTSSPASVPPAPARPAENLPSQSSSSDATTLTIVQDKVECIPEVQHFTPQQTQAANLPTSQQVEKHCISSPGRAAVARKQPKNKHIPNFQRPLLSKQMANWFFAGNANDLDDKQLILGEMGSTMDVPSSLAEALSLGLDPRSDWMMRAFAFSSLLSVLQHQPRGVQEVAQNFEKAMKLVSRYLDDPHHKVARAALSSVAEIIPTFKKPFEGYLERTLPHVFSQLNHPKELIRQQCSEILKLAGANYTIDSLLPALLRSLDEQKSPKSKLAVLEFANVSFDKCTVNSDSYFSSSFLKPWLGKLALLFKDKNNKLKEAALAGFTSVYSHYDHTSVLSFVVSMSVGEQKRLRRALKQFIPAMETDLERFLQQRRQRQHIPSFDPFSVMGQTFTKGYSIEKQNKNQLLQAYSADAAETGHEIGSEFSGEPACHKADMDKSSSAARYAYNTTRSCDETNESGISMATHVRNGHLFDAGAPICQILHQEVMNQMGEVPQANEHCVPIKHLHQMSSSILEMLDDPDESSKELALSLLAEILEKQRTAMESCTDTLIAKLLHATKDAAMKVVNQAHNCLTTVVTQFDPLKCLSAIAPLLVCEDKKVLIISINSLSKLVTRLSQEDLMAHLPAFLPALLDAFENLSPYVRKTVVLCLVDIYLKLGAAFLPYLERLDSTQLQLVTAYASRLAQTSRLIMAEDA